MGKYQKLLNILEKDLRLISLTPGDSKIAEEFIFEDYVNPAVLHLTNPSQYGAILNPSTTMAIISMLHLSLVCKH